MSKPSVLVLSAAYTTDASRWRLLRESAAKHGVPLHVLGIGESYPDMNFFPMAIDFLKSRTEDHVVLTDGYDVIVNRWDERELAYRIDAAPHLVMSVESNVWPDGPWAERYAHLNPLLYPWRAICGGQYCGRREQMIEVWEEMTVRWERGDAKAGGTSQEILHRMYADGVPFTLDLKCEIFQSMLGPYTEKVIDGTPGFGVLTAYNTFTKSYPMFLHFNGQSGVIPEPWVSL